MQISFKHCNPQTGHESTLLHFDREDEEELSYLIDAGEGAANQVDEIDGILLTHAHFDHYSEVGPVLEQNPTVNLYTSPATANFLKQTYAEADQYQDVGDVEVLMDCLTPIETWHSLTDDIDVFPIPAGHTPGAVGFLFRVNDIHKGNETPTILVTGDFTTHPVAGYPGLTLPPETHVDVMIANVATEDNYEENLKTACETTLSHAFGGATTLVATSALTGVHLAYLLGYLLQELERNAPLILVGQAAKVYEDLSYEVPNVKVCKDFTHTNEVLRPGGITIAGPELPTQGSTSRLLGVIQDDPSAAFGQVTGSEPEIPDRLTCSTYHVQLTHHPEKQEIIEIVQDYFPRHLIAKHTSTDKAKELEEELNNFFVWSNDDTESHLLYDDGDWLSPEWVPEDHANRIKGRIFRKVGTRLLLDQPTEKLPAISLDRRSSNLEAEGIDVEQLIETFRLPANPYSQENGDVSTAQEGAGAKTTSKGGEGTMSVVESNGGASTTTDGVSNGSDGEAIVPHPTECEASVLSEEVLSRLTEIDERLTALEETAASRESGAATLEETLDERLTVLDERLTALSADDDYEIVDVEGSIIEQDDLLLLRLSKEDLKSDKDRLTHGRDVTVSFSLQD